MSKGYIYVLANSSMPNVVKVGKTTRLPSLRAQELSGATGVATPFIVVYEKDFNDCDFAESYIHELLSIKGFRVSHNREFFNAPVSEVINAVLQAVLQDAEKIERKDENNEDEYFDTSTSDLDELTFDDKLHLPKWFDIWKEAEDYYKGNEDIIQDYDEAMRLFKQVIKLGCALAYGRIGMMYLKGEGVLQSYKKSFDWFKEGAKKNNYFCCIMMAGFYSAQGEMKNFTKCLKSFARMRKEHFDSFIESELGLFYVITMSLAAWSRLDFVMPSEFIDFLSDCSSEINASIDQMNEYASNGLLDIDIEEIRESYNYLLSEK